MARSSLLVLCPTVVSMVFDISENIVFWCENRKWDQVEKKKIG